VPAASLDAPGEAGLSVRQLRRAEAAARNCSACYIDGGGKVCCCGAA